MAGKRRPGPDGTTTGFWHPVNAAFGWVRTQTHHASSALKTFGERAAGTGKSILLGILDVVHIKPDSPYSTKLLQHYVEGSGEPYDLGEIPREWQDWIVKTTKGKEGRYYLNPYNSGLYDLRNSLGHFEVVVTNNDNTIDQTYEIRDIYEFGYIKNDRNQRGRHGFPLGQPDENTIRLIELLVPSGEQQNPGGFRERWEVIKTGKETILYIPQEVLAEQGKPFEVYGKFFRVKESKRREATHPH